MMKNARKALHLTFLIILTLPSSYAQEILLPVEVLGAEGTTVTRTFNLSAEEFAQAQRLWLQVNNLSYENKGSIKINNQPWLSLNHETVDMQAQEKARGGMVHGGFNTIRFSIPATGIASESNTISFRFDLSDGISNGYRVVRFNLLDENSEKILPQNRFEEDNPQTWAPTYTDAASIAEGKDLWYNGQLKNHYLPPGRKGFWYDHELPEVRTLHATCSSCHAQDGRDLEMFSYSNHSIIERAKFHQLSEDQGKKIVSYIRSLSTTKENVGRYGRPWNPPYQPGPSLDTVPIEKWAAGAGLDAVLDNDKDMLPYMFPHGVSQETVYERFDSDKSFDRTLIPLAIQFPDWKHWLPIIHPVDAYNKNNYYSSESTGPNNPNKKYKEVRQYLETNAPAGFPNKQELANEIQTLHNHFRFFVEQGGTIRDHWRTSDGDATKNLNDGIPRELAATSLARLFAVKNFEFVTEFDLQDKAADFGNPADQFQPRQWPGNEYNVFEIPPHFQACVDNNCNQFIGQPTETGMYESTNWYQLQLVINGGDGNMSWNSPVDYNYHPDFITKACNSSGVDEPLRYYHSMNAMYQTKTWSGGQSPNSGVGFRIRVMGPWNIYGITDGNQFNGFAPGEFAKLLDEVKPGMTAWVMNAMLRQFLTEVHKPYNSLDIWNRTEHGDDNSLDRADKTYADIIDAVERTERQETFFWHYAAKFYYYIPRFQKLGVDCEIMEELIDWCQEAWPLIDWHVFSNKGEMQLNLLLDDELFCSQTNFIRAVATNNEDNTVYNWTMNGNPLSLTGNELSIENIESGDEIKCQISSSRSCLVEDNVEATFIMPSSGADFSIKIGTAQEFRPLSNSTACLNDQLEMKMDIDIQPKMWLDALDVNVGDEPTDNSFISSWSDKSGNGFSAKATRPELQPKYMINAMNGLPAVVFGANNDADGLELFSTTEDDFMNNDWTIILVGKTEKPEGNEDWRDLIGNKTEGDNGWFFRFGNTARVQLGIGPDLEHGKEYDFNRSFIAEITKEGDVITTYLNGRSDRKITKRSEVNMVINEALYLGQSSNGWPFTTRYHKGPVAELMVFEHAISKAEREFLEGYLTHKWKLNDELAYTHPYAQHSPVDFYLNTPAGEVYEFNSLQTTGTIQLDQENTFGDYSLIKAVCATEVESFKVSKAVPTPYNGTPHTIPGIIEAEEYDLGGEGCAYHDVTVANEGNAFRTTESVDIESTGDATGGYNVGWTADGEWLEYTVDVAGNDVYTFTFRIASENGGGSFHVEMDGSVLIPTQTVNASGGWQEYIDLSIEGITLSTGVHHMKFLIEQGGFNINSITIETAPKDCNQTPYGTAFLDNCDECVVTDQDACTQDCNGEWGGAATYDVCNECRGGTTGETPVTSADLCVTSISEAKQETISIVPNPFTSGFKISLPDHDLATVVVLSSDGKVLIPEQTYNGQILGRSLAAGVYIVKVVRKSHATFYKVVKH